MSKDLIYFIASIIGISSFFLTEMLLLRSIYLVSSILFVISGIVFGLDIIIIMNVFYALVNIVQISLLLRQRSTKSIPAQLNVTYKQVFNIMTPYEFSYLIDKSIKKRAKAKSLLLKEGAANTQLLYIYKGNVSIERKNKKIVNLEKRVFVGEMSFITGETIVANVKALDDVEYLTWKFNDLYKLKRKRKDIYMKLLAVIGKDLIEKVHKNSAI